VRAVEARRRESSGRSRTARRRGRAGIAAGVVCCALAAAPVAASAATLAITSAPDPVESITTQVGVAGTLETSDQRVALTVKPAGGPVCGANPSADSGSTAVGTYPGIGPYAKIANWTFAQAGSYLLCGWITDAAQSGSPVIASASQTIAVRLPHLSLSIAAPSKVLRGRTFQVATTAQAEAERDVEVVLLKDTGRGCPANWGAAIATSGETTVLRVSVTGGPTTQTQNERIDATGRYLVCGYFDYDNNVSPEATAVASTSVTPPCTVPHLGSGVPLRKAKARIVAAHCTVGKVRYATSTRHARGTVIALNPRPGSGKATHAPVQITVSSGPPRHRRHS
jgi:hypothetical protein